MKSLIVTGRARLAMARALETTEQSALAIRSEPPPPVAAEPRKRVTEVDLPRVCAVHGRGYISRYVSDAKGRFHYAQSFRFKEHFGDQYEDSTAATVPNDQLADEACPWCGAVGLGSIKCGTCHMEICYGRTTAAGQFTCRDACTGSGRLAPKNRDMQGYVPGMRPPGTVGT